MVVRCLLLVIGCWLLVIGIINDGLVINDQLVSCFHSLIFPSIPPEARSSPSGLKRMVLTDV
ncbi:hypothetical protein NJ959_07465 [Symplocastrum sp. BBK-W-15]|uniref:Uncharacterized protein n=1 Tax=Limnofasciculus baicalensis BBK-W-15 TaxID=2699891 RepID=A0AAE3KM21_9CYAN|nr:hypothetical protein [Limnofasciculus baicalensis]MCP2728311.1 hypothetical protein [Limnofasciculus baicalensis BBK-W-15]